MAGHAPPRELLAGGAAIAALFIGLAIGMTPWLAIPLAVITYVSIVWLGPHRQDQVTTETNRQRLALQSALANTEALGMLQQRIPKPAVREQVGRILDRIVATHRRVAIGSYPRLDAPDHRVKLTVESRDAAAVDEAVAALVAALPPEVVVRVQ